MYIQTSTQGDTLGTVTEQMHGVRKVKSVCFDNEHDDSEEEMFETNITRTPLTVKDIQHDDEGNVIGDDGSEHDEGLYETPHTAITTGTTSHDPTPGDRL